MKVTVLGTASIGGVPEWDCTCPNCVQARQNKELERTRSSIAVSLDEDKYILFDAGHDIKTQFERNGLTPRPNVVDESLRESRLDSIFLTHGHADHTVGIAEFCTGKSFEIPVYAPPDLIEFLFGTETQPNYFGELGRLARNYVTPIKLPEKEPVKRMGLEVKGIEIPHTMVLDSGRKYPSSTYAYEIKHNDKRLVYAPDIGRLDPWFLDFIEGADVFMMDATFWWDDELNRISGIPVTSYQLGHVPQEDAVEILADCNIGKVVFTHFNHTNPVISPESTQSKNVEKAGMKNAFDGMKMEI